VARYVYEGPGPQPGDDGGITRPGDVREFSEAPAGGPWRLMEDTGPLAAPEPPVSLPQPPSPAAGPDAASAPASAALRPAGTEGN
jgi:hypothetical protein